MPALGPHVSPPPNDARARGRLTAPAMGISIERAASGRNSGSDNLWLYALPNPNPENPIRQERLLPRGQRAVIYGLSWTQLAEHPLRPRLREKLLLDRPAAASLNQL